MKNPIQIKNLILLSILAMMCAFACKKDKTIHTVHLDDFIIAGKGLGQGIKYVNIEPDIIISLNPWLKQDTSISLDLNADEADDLKITIHKSNPGMLGMGFSSNNLVPLGNNEVCIVANNIDTISGNCHHSSLTWIDTLTASDTINGHRLWSTNESLFSSYLWVIEQCSISDGLWQNVIHTNEKYLGFKIVKGEKAYYGWIGLFMSGSGITITDYAFTEEYEE